MNIDTLLDDITAQLRHHLERFDALAIPGSILVAVHRDSGGARKVVVSTEESWPIKRL